MVTRLANLWHGFSTLLKFDNRMQLVLNRLLFRQQALVIYRTRGMDVLVDHGGDDQNGTRACLISDMYARYYHLIPTSRPLNVMDLGANGGGLALSLVAHGFTFDRLACVEMNPNTFSRLQFNVLRNVPAKHTHLINAAAYHSDGMLSLKLGRGGTNDSVHAAKGAEKATVEKSVATRSFDSLVQECFCDARIDLCKIDIEGAEFEMLLSDATTHLRNVRFIIIEIHPHPTRGKAELLSVLANMGFEEFSAEHETSGGCSVHVLRNTACGPES
jgi:FkbM family methyltransferase